MLHLRILILTLLVLVPGPVMARKKEQENRIIDNVMAGVTLAFSGNPGAGGHHFTEALKVLERPQLYSLILLAMVEAKETVAAVKLCGQNVRIALSDPNFHYWCGRLYWEAGNRSAAVTAMENALSLGGDRPHFLMTAALMQAGTRNAARAELYFHRLIRRDPWILHTKLYPDSLMGMLFVLEDLFTQMEMSARFRHGLAALAFRGNYLDLSLEFMEAAWKGYGTVPEELHQLRHQLFRAWGRSAMAEKAYSEGIKAHPRSVHFRFHRALALMEENRPERARRVLVEMVKDDPRSVLIHSLLALSWLQTGQLESARKSLEYARAQNEELPLLTYADGLYHQRSGQPDRALVLLERAVRMEPTNLQYGAAYLAALTASDRKAAVKAEENRQKVVRKLLQDIQEHETRYQKRLESLTLLYKEVREGRPVKFPTPCDVQCQVLRGHVELAANRPWKAAPVLARLSPKKLWFPELPVHAWRREVTVKPGDKLVVVKFFQSVQPTLLD